MNETTKRTNVWLCLTIPIAASLAIVAGEISANSGRIIGGGAGAEKDIHSALGGSFVD